MSITAGAWKRFCGITQPARLAGALTLAAGVLMFGSVAAQEPADRVTVQLRGGDRISGTLEDLEGGTLFIRVSLHDQRKIPMSDVARIDRAGTAGLPEPELSRSRGNRPMVVLSNGTTLDATLTDVEGGEGSADPGKPREFIVRTPTGEERRLRAGDVDRIYMGGYPAPAGTPRATGTRGTRDDAPPSEAGGGRVRVSARERWVDTGLTVRQGQEIGFQTIGQVQLSASDNDLASPAGGPRTAANAPMPDAPAGALIGRIGAAGRAFAIGNLTQVTMPESGRLYLGVNDDELSDNAGGYEIVLTPRR